MLRRSVRIFVLLLTVAVTAGVVWKVTTNEQLRGRARLASQQRDATAADALFTLADIRSSLYAYVAPGQGYDFWAARAKPELDTLRARLTEVDEAATAAGYPLTAAFENLDKLSATERRAHSYVRGGQMLAAGDVIFTDARDLVDAVGRELSAARQAMSRAESSREGGMANEQSLMAGALMAVWIVALILLVPVPGTPAPIARAAEPAAAPAPPVTSAPPAEAAALANLPLRETPAPTAAPEPPPVAEVVVPSSTPLFQDLAALCLDLGRVSDAEELNPLLERAAEVLDARGVVVWLLAEDRQELVPAVAYGYDPQVLARLGPLTLTVDNLTASAFRTAAPAISGAVANHEAAVAVPILSATGPSGVLTAEVHDSGELDRAVAIASVVAAQLANLFPAPTTAEGPPEEAVNV
jgi:hypothetical protein